MLKCEATLKTALLAFLRAELDSPFESEHVRATLERVGVPEGMIIGTAADIETVWNFFMEYRGRQTVFDGLNLRVLDWYWTELTLEDVETKTWTCIHHFEETFGTRRPNAIAKRWNESLEPNGVLEKIQKGQKLEPPILIGDPNFQKLVILEGHNRLISYLRDPSAVQFPVAALVGTSATVSRWCQW